MRFTAIEINNFRQYQTLSFKFPKSAEHDLHIIVADNGVGKTNILNAITWCLYEDEPHLGNKSKSLPRLNTKAKNEAIHSGQANIVVSVKIYAEDADDVIIYSRKMSVRADSGFEAKSELTVTINSSGDAKIYDGEHASGYVERYMPQRIRKFFYFDGEQLDSYFISDETSKIKETIHAISQVDVVSRVIDRLGKIIIAKRSDAGKKAPDIRALNENLTEIEKEIEGIRREIAELDKQIALSETIIKTNTERLSGQENLPELEERYQKLLAQKSSLEEQRIEAEKTLFIFVREMKIALSFYKNARKTLDIIAEKKAQNALPPNIDRQVLRQILDEGHCSICDHSLSDNAKEYIEQLLSKITVSSSTSNLLMSIFSELERIVSTAQKYPQEKETILKKYKGICDSLGECERDLQLLDDERSKFEDKQQVINWHSEREVHMELIDTNRSKKAVAAYQLSNALANQNSTENNLKKALAKEQECARLNQLIAFASDAKCVVWSIESDMMSEVRRKMEKLTTEYFASLIWKQGIYDHIALDEKYQLDLIHRDGYSCVGSCSAGERSLLALSFTLALHEVSGFNSLLFIDTPVARLTGQNRVNFANVLQQTSTEKQLIIAFTPDEYSESIKNVFGRIASTSVHLSMNSDNEITSIKEGS